MEPKKKEKKSTRTPTFEPIDPALTEDRLTMEYDTGKLEKIIPALTRELISGETQSISFANALREVEDSEESNIADADEKITNLNTDDQELINPDTVSFIRRCSNSEEALEIITYMEKRGEISPIDADQYRSQLFTQGS